MTSALDRLIDAQGVLVLDGGLATSLEAHGCDLDHELWSARVLVERPELVRLVHREFLAAGADCIVSATYQASLPGLKRHGLGEKQAERILRDAVSLAVDVRDTFWEDPANREERRRPLVAAGVGPYGAVLADGSEYHGAYGMSVDQLHAFHERRWQILASTRADLLACETIPSFVEVCALLRLLDETPGARAWIACSCRDGRRIGDGTRMREVARACDEHDGAVAVGVNCTAPDLIVPLIAEIRSATDKPVVVYPNSGERYDPVHKTWSDGAVPSDWGGAARRWAEAGASVIGGCCRTGTREIRAVREALLVSGPSAPSPPRHALGP